MNDEISIYAAIALSVFSFFLGGAYALSLSPPTARRIFKYAAWILGFRI
jgi:hypothetical protein